MNCIHCGREGGIVGGKLGHRFFKCSGACYYFLSNDTRNETGERKMKELKELMKGYDEDFLVSDECPGCGRDGTIHEHDNGGFYFFCRNCRESDDFYQPKVFDSKVETLFELEKSRK